MTDVPLKPVHREPHPFVSAQHLPTYIGLTVAFVGRAHKKEEGGTVLIMKTGDEREVRVNKFRGEAPPEG